ncbi:hypothetical protein PT974_09193 [Cladobotryum mycophilum]|uniref:Mg2+ transporter n=1 Tax=Cladobotryum mycophilum TaxID=491253 RepID=A0ABR0SFJ0_9HYPO
MAYSEARRRRDRQPFLHISDPSDDNPNQRRAHYLYAEPPRRIRRDGVELRGERRGRIRMDGNPNSRSSAYEEIEAPVARRRVINRVIEPRSAPVSYRPQQSFERNAPVQVENAPIDSADDGNIAEAAAFRYSDSPVLFENDEDQGLQRRQSFEDRWINREAEGTRRWTKRDSGRDESPPPITREEIIVPERDAEKTFVVEDPRRYEGQDPWLRAYSPVEDMDAFDEFQFIFPNTDISREVDLSDQESPSIETESTQKAESAISVGQKPVLFRWLHVRQGVMNFDELWSEVARQIRFSEVERSAIAKLRAEVKRRCIKSRYNPKGAKVGYMEPRCIRVPLQTSNKGGSLNTKAVTWICLPYFSLQQYSGLLSASNTALFPAQTILQSQYSRSVLVTCGTMSQAELQGDYLKINSEPSQGLGTGSGRILVCYGTAVMWVFLTKDCQTWFAFMSHFHEFWPKVTEFRRNDHVVTATSWKQILKIAEGPRGSVTLTLKIIDSIDPPRAFSKPKNPEYLTTQDDPNQSKQMPEYLHVLTLLPGELESPSPDGLLKHLDEQLTAADRFLTEQTSYSAQRGYKECDGATRTDVYTRLSQLAGQVEERGSDEVRLAYDLRIELFNAADTLFQFFFPVKFQGPTTGKFWGSLKKLVKIPKLDGETPGSDYLASITNLKRELFLMAQGIQAFQNIMSHAGKIERERLELPREFVTAWLHVVSGMIAASHMRYWDNHIMKANSLICDGMDKIMQSISTEDIVDKAAMLPMEVVSLISLNLLQDKVGKFDDISGTYSQYLNSLDTDITTKPTDRSYQHRIDLVQQEMTAIKRNITKQWDIVLAILRNRSSSAEGTTSVRYAEDTPGYMKRARERHVYYDRPDYNRDAYQGFQPRPYGTEERLLRRAANDYERPDDQFLDDLESASKLSPTDPSGFRGLFLSECLKLVEQRTFEFKKYTEYAAQLEQENNYKMEWTKDRQENAIYAFTIVTIVFLPISAISSIFGMNTTDIRDMEFGQWLYWVVALPVTLIVIIAGLWWMNELGNVTRWLLGKRSTRYRVSGDAVVVSPQHVTDSDSITESVDVIYPAQRPETAPPMVTVRPPMVRARRKSYYRY